MHLRLRAVLAVVGALLLATVFMPRGAQAQEAPTVTVTPSTGLQDGQTVLVEASGFTGTPAAPWAVLQCDAAVVGATDVPTVNESCIGANGLLVQSVSSSFSTPLTVVLSGTSFQGGNTITCGVTPGDCVVFVGQILLAGGAQIATAPITFGPPTPTTKADCKNGGWRDLADDQGQPFRNEGLCVAYVVARRP